MSLDLARVKGIVGGRAVMTIPALGPDVDVFHQQPSDLGDTCERCAEHGCHPMASVSWPIEGSNEADYIVVGRACLPDAVDHARANSTDARPIYVEVPVWRSPAALQAAGITYRQLDYWTRIGRLHPEVEAAGSGSQRLYAADEVAMARRMGVLALTHMDCRVADDLLAHHPEVVEALVTALTETKGEAA